MKFVSNSIFLTSKALSCRKEHIYLVTGLDEIYPTSQLSVLRALGDFLRKSGLKIVHHQGCLPCKLQYCSTVQTNSTEKARETLERGVEKCSENDHPVAAV